MCAYKINIRKKHKKLLSCRCSDFLFVCSRHATRSEGKGEMVFCCESVGGEKGEEEEEEEDGSTNTQKRRKRGVKRIIRALAPPLGTTHEQTMHTIHEIIRNAATSTSQVVPTHTQYGWTIVLVCALTLVNVACTCMQIWNRGGVACESGSSGGSCAE